MLCSVPPLVATAMAEVGAAGLSTASMAMLHVFLLLEEGDVSGKTLMPIL